MTSEFRERLQSDLGNVHVLERELGGGGMSRVFLARETALQRQVVVKVLSPELAAGVSVERFLREVQFAARLQHPHIVPVHTTGMAAGLPYYTMPFVAGATLRDRLSSGPVPVDEAVRILRDVARALEYAHGHGIVHRDIKPANILLAGSSATVTDFGIAKALSASRTRADDDASADTGMHLTAAGSSLGTPAYMAPEQAAGAPDVDQRADLYSFGCVAYEVLSGSLPFAARAPHQMILAHMAEPPPPLADRVPSLPPALTELVMQCLEKDPARRPRDAAALLAVLDGAHATSVPADTPRRTSSRHRAAWLAGALLVIVAGVLLLPRLRPAGVTVAAAPTVKAVAVIPFFNVDGDTATEYFSDGVSDELATALGRLPGLRVTARSGAYAYKGRRDLDVREVGKALGADYVLMGTARRTGTSVRLSAQLTNAADGVEIWSHQFDHAWSELLSTQDSLTSEISEQLSARLGAPTRAASTAPPAYDPGTQNPEAFDAYLHGISFLQRRRAELAGAVESFELAIARDTTFARAYAGLGSALALQTYYGDPPPAHWLERSVDAARHALALDSTQASAYVALGIVATVRNQWQSGLDDFHHAIVLDPNSSDAHFQLGRELLYLGQPKAAADAFERARAIDPLSQTVAVWLGKALSWAGDHDQALAEAQRAWELDSTSAIVLNVAPGIYLNEGRLAQARRVASVQSSANISYGIRAYVLARAGAEAEAKALVQHIMARGGTGWFDQINLHLYYLGIGDTTRALDAMEKAVQRGEPLAAFEPLSQPMYDPVRASPRFAQLLHDVGLDSVAMTGIAAALRQGSGP